MGESVSQYIAIGKLHFRKRRGDWFLDMSLAVPYRLINIEGRVLSQVVQLQRQRGWSLVPYCSIRKRNIDGEEEKWKEEGSSGSGNVHL